MNYDWKAFDLHFYYPARLEEVWTCWATPAGLCRFFVQDCPTTDSAGLPRDPTRTFAVGDHYRFRWRHGFEARGTVLEVIPERRLSITFGSMRVDVNLAEAPGAIHVHLRQSDIPDTEDGRVQDHLNCRSCWIFFMTNLVSVLKTGTDLRDVDPARVSSMEVGYTPRS